MTHALAWSLAALSLAGLIGCDTDASTDAAADVPSVDVAPVDAVTHDVATDAADASVAAFSAMTAVTAIHQNCMPAVPRDPLTLSGTVALTNSGSIPIGPITLSTGLVVRLLGGDTLATFGVTPVTLAAVAPRQTGSVMFVKTADSLANDAGAQGCQIVPCGTPVRIVMPLAGTNVPDGARAASEPMTIPCVQ